MDDCRIYLLVRKDLSWSQRVVQAAHAAMQLVMHKHQHLAGQWPEVGPNLVVYGVSKDQLAGIAEELPGEYTQEFLEPDWGDAITAVAYCGPRLEWFDNLALL